MALLLAAGIVALAIALWQVGDQRPRPEAEFRALHDSLTGSRTGRSSTTASLHALAQSDTATAPAPP